MWEKLYTYVCRPEHQFFTDNESPCSDYILLCLSYVWYLRKLRIWLVSGKLSMHLMKASWKFCSCFACSSELTSSGSLCWVFAIINNYGTLCLPKPIQYFVFLIIGAPGLGWSWGKGSRLWRWRRWTFWSLGVWKWDNKHTVIQYTGRWQGKF